MTTIDYIIAAWKIAHPEQFNFVLFVIVAITIAFCAYLFITWKNDMACKAAQQAARKFYNHM